MAKSPPSLSSLWRLLPGVACGGAPAACLRHHEEGRRKRKMTRGKTKGGGREKGFWQGTWSVQSQLIMHIEGKTRRRGRGPRRRHAGSPLLFNFFLRGAPTFETRTFFSSFVWFLSNITLTPKCLWSLAFTMSRWAGCRQSGRRGSHGVSTRGRERREAWREGAGPLKETTGVEGKR